MGIIEALDEATDKDLADLDREIDIQAKRLESLRAARKILAARFEEPKKKAENADPKPEQNALRDPLVDDTKLLERIYDMLSGGASMKAGEIAQVVNETPQKVGVALKRSDWFVRDSLGYWEIARTGE